jgi:hypothetical protein
MTHAPAFSARFGRFVRWFFTASPEADLPPLPVAAPRSRTVSHCPPAQTRARHAGPVRVGAKAET